MVVIATLSWAFLIDALCWNPLSLKAPNHAKVTFIEGECMVGIEWMVNQRLRSGGLSNTGVIRKGIVSKKWGKKQTYAYLQFL